MNVQYRPPVARQRSTASLFTKAIVVAARADMRKSSAAFEARVLRSQAETAGKIAESFGELRGLIAAIDPTQARAKGGEFRFANEKSAECGDEPVDLPNPLPRRAIN
jgi:hypothetical protein